VVATYTDGQLTQESVASAATAAVANVNSAPNGSVVITGTAGEGEILTASNTLTDEDGMGAVSYQWQADGTDIAGAIGATLTLTAAQLGAAITVLASYTDQQGTNEAVASLPTLVAAPTPPAYFLFTLTDTSTEGQTGAALYNGPVAGLTYAFMGSAADEAVFGTASNDFINLGAGDDAVNGGGGDDVLDGGTGSNFLTGGAGSEVFFLDGRGGTVTWSTITDWEPGEQLSVWGWNPGTSKASWVASDGALGWKGVTMHGDLNGDGITETSVTWTGRSQLDLPTPIQQEGLLWFIG
jgi:serralysin